MGTLRHSRRFTLACASVVTLIVGACAGPASPSAASQAAAPPSATASATASAPAALIVGGDRPVTVHVPASYDASHPTPLLILLHGYSASGHEIDTYFNLGPAAEARGFVYAVPDGTFDS